MHLVAHAQHQNACADHRVARGVRQATSGAQHVARWLHHVRRATPCEVYPRASDTDVAAVPPRPSQTLSIPTWAGKDIVHVMGGNMQGGCDAPDTSAMARLGDSSSGRKS